MKLIILAAGQGTRLRPYTDNIPKCMVEFKNKPIIDYILEAAYSCNINKTIEDGFSNKQNEIEIIPSDQLSGNIDTEQEPTVDVSAMAGSQALKDIKADL